MPATAHTQEPWFVIEENPSVIGHKRGGETFAIGLVHSDRDVSVTNGIVGLPHSPIDHDKTLANGKRIVACVNGCADINPDAVPALLEALKDILTLVMATGKLDSNLMFDSDFIAKAQAAITKATEKRV